MLIGVSNRDCWRGARRLLIGASLTAVLACGDERGYGIDAAVADRPLPERGTPVDTALARAGGLVFHDRCVACHKLGPGLAVGPDLLGVFERREAGWIRAMVSNPDSMLRTDSIARALLYSYQVPMIDTELGEPEVRAVMEFLRAQRRAPPTPCAAGSASCGS
jgi:mono/diheme cytochrome c family protein